MDEILGIASIWYYIAFVTSLAAATVSHVLKYRSKLYEEGVPWKRFWIDYVADIIISVFVGFGLLLFCHHYGYSPIPSVLLIAAGGLFNRSFGTIFETLAPEIATVGKSVIAGMLQNWASVLSPTNKDSSDNGPKKP